MYYYLGHEKREYTNKDGKQVVGYNLFLAKDDHGVVGIRPMMRFDVSRKSLGFLYLSEQVFKDLGIASLTPSCKVDLLFNEYGNIKKITKAS